MRNHCVSSLNRGFLLFLLPFALADGATTASVPAPALTGHLSAITGTLTASPSTLTLNIPVNVPETQTITLTYTNVFKLGPVLQSTAATADGLPWMTVSPTSVTMPLTSFDGTTYTYTSTVTLALDPMYFGPGYSGLTGNISFTAADGTASTSVTMNVVDPVPLTVTPKSLSFNYTQGASTLPAAQSLSITSTPAGADFSASAATTSGGNWLSVQAASGTTPGSVPVSVNVTNLAPGPYAGTVTIFFGANSIVVPVSLTIISPNAPVIKPGGVVPIYSTLTSIQAGSWISIYGTNLASTAATWNGNFPTSLGGVSVMVDGKPAYLWYVSPTQINLQAPDDTATGSVNVVVTNGSGSFTATTTLVSTSPSFSLLDSTHAAGVIITPNGAGAYGGGTYDLLGPTGAFSYKTRPVIPGETLELYGVGFGPTNPPVPAGQVFTSSAPTVYPVTITIGGVTANVSFAGITAAGLYQFNLTVPNTGAGDQALQATVNGVQTQPGPVVTVQ